MLKLRPAAERGHMNHGWLQARHTFSFGRYLDPAHMGFRDLRVINDDTVQPGMGFDTHGHKDMEIITYVLDGALAHKDSMGSASVLRPGDVQRMTAGHGVMHSEFNASEDQELRLLQIWINPEAHGLEPGYEEKCFGDEDKRGRLRLIVSREGQEGSLRIHQDARVFAGLFTRGESAVYQTEKDRHLWLQVARGDVRAAGRDLSEGDGLAVSGEERLEIDGIEGGEILLFDLK